MTRFRPESGRSASMESFVTNPFADPPCQDCPEASVADHTIQNSSPFWHESSSIASSSSRETVLTMNSAQELALAVQSKVYSVELLIELQKTLPYLKCSLKAFSAEAWRAQLLQPPNTKGVVGKTWFPADFPQVGVRQQSTLPSHEIPLTTMDTSAEFDEEIVHRGKTQNKVESMNPSRQPIPPPRGIVPQQDAGFARFLKEVASPTHKRVTAGGRIVSAEFPPANQQFARMQPAPLPYPTVLAHVPNMGLQTYYYISPDSYSVGPAGEVMLHNVSQEQFATALPPGQFQQPMPPVHMNTLLPPQIASIPPWQMAQMPPIQPYTLPPRSFPGNGVPLPQLPLENMTNTMNIRTPRVTFPIGSQFEFEQNQQALRDRLAQLQYEMSNLSYMTREDAKRKIMEKELVEEQIEQFRQVWELQCQLSASANGSTVANVAQKKLQEWEAKLAQTKLAADKKNFVTKKPTAISPSTGTDSNYFKAMTSDQNSKGSTALVVAAAKAIKDVAAGPGHGPSEQHEQLLTAQAHLKHSPLSNPDEAAVAPEKTPEEKAADREAELEKLRVSAGMPMRRADYGKSHKVAIDNNAFADQIANVTLAARSFFNNASAEQLEAAKADHSNPKHPLFYMDDAKKEAIASNIKGKAKARDSDNEAGDSVIISAKVQGKQRVTEASIGSIPSGQWVPTTSSSNAEASLRRLYNSDKGKQPMRMETIASETEEESMDVAETHKIDKENVKAAQVIGTLNDRDTQKAFLDTMLQDSRYTGMNFGSACFEKLVAEEMKKHKVRAAVASNNQRQGDKEGGGWQGKALQKQKLKSPLSPPVPSVTAANASWHAEGSNVAPTPHVGRLHGADMLSSSTGNTRRDFKPSHIETTPRTSSGVQSQQEDIVAFFERLRWDEQEEIVRYKAQQARAAKHG